MNSPPICRWGTRAGRRRAFLLLTVLVALLISGLLLAATARRSLLLATEAVDRQRDLQLKWGAHSCQRAVLSAARDVIADGPAPAVDGTFRLGTALFRWRLSDEDAKVNLNTVYHFDGEAAVDRLLGAAWPAVAVRLMPEMPSQGLSRRPLDEWGDVAPPAAFRSWGQVVDLSVSAVRLPVITSDTTCWGSGQLNVVRASDQSIRSLAGLVLPRAAVDRLVEDVRKYPQRPLERLFEQLGVDQQDRFLLQELLTKQSSSYGLWVTGNVGQQVGQLLSVSERIEWLDEDGNLQSTTRRQSFVF